MHLDPHTHLWLASRRVAEATTSRRATRRVRDGHADARTALRLLRPPRVQRPCPTC